MTAAQLRLMDAVAEALEFFPDISKEAAWVQELDDALKCARNDPDDIGHLEVGK